MDISESSNKNADIALALGCETTSFEVRHGPEIIR
jgi:hypothetical protein